MRSATLASAATLLVGTQAIIGGFYAPQNMMPDADVKLEIFTEGYIQSTEDVAIVFGLSTAKSVFMGALGNVLSHKALGKDFSNADGNITHYFHVPATFPRGPAILQAAHFSLMGSSRGPTTVVFYANVTIGEGNQWPYVTSALIPQVDK